MKQPYQRWDTPVSDSRSLAMVSLSDTSDGLRITVVDPRTQLSPLTTFHFKSFAAYRNILEEFRLSDDGPSSRTEGWTLIGTHSSWKIQLLASEPLIEVHAKGAEHYQIITEDDIIDILSNTPPEITLTPLDEHTKVRAGKSRVLYNSEDRKEIESVIADIIKRNERG